MYYGTNKSFCTDNPTLAVISHIISQCIFKKTSTDPTSNIKIICYVMHWFYMLFTLHPFLSSKAVAIKLKLIKYAMLNLPSKV